MLPFGVTVQYSSLKCPFWLVFPVTARAGRRERPDRHAGGLEVGNIAIDGALGHFELFRQLARGNQSSAAEFLYDLKETVCTSHPA